MFCVLNCGYTTPLYHEGEHFFLPGEYLSYFADKIGGGGDSAISFRFFFPDSDFFHIHSDLSLLESGRSGFFISFEIVFVIES